MVDRRGPVSEFILNQFHHFNAATLVDAARGFEAHVGKSGKMLLAMAGAMSTAELGCSLAEMIRQDKIHGICCTGANLEEDIFNLVAHNEYVRIPHWRDLTPQEEMELCNRGLNRVTDTCIPEVSAMRKVENIIIEEWVRADNEGKTYAPHEFIYMMLESKCLEPEYQIDPKNSWLIAAFEKKLPIFTPGWEDSTLGNVFAACCMQGKLKHAHTVESGIQLMIRLATWYKDVSSKHALGLFQIGGGIAGDFPICVVPMLIQDLKWMETPLWGYFCQISDSTTSYGSYSGAIQNEKITWGKLDVDTPKYIIESDATIVAPLIFAYILNW